jgi:hypothetical protein
MGAQNCVERGLGVMVVVTPVTVEVWMSSWWNDRGHVGSSLWGEFSIFLFPSLSHFLARVDGKCEH